MGCTEYSENESRAKQKRNKRETERERERERKTERRNGSFRFSMKRNPARKMGKLGK